MKYEDTFSYRNNGPKVLSSTFLDRKFYRNVLLRGNFLNVLLVLFSLWENYRKIDKNEKPNKIDFNYLVITSEIIVL